MIALLRFHLRCGLLKLLKYVVGLLCRNSSLPRMTARKDGQDGCLAQSVRAANS